MKKLIDADKLINDIPNQIDITERMMDKIKSVIDSQETVELKEGRWIASGGEGFECSECWGMSEKPSLYCPVCGSRNKLEERR